MPHIRHELVIAAPAETIYNAITTEGGLSSWWTPATKAKPEVNSIARFGFGPAYSKEMKIVKLIPYEQIQWVCMTGAEEWMGTTLTFQLQPGDKELFLKSHPELTDQVQQQKHMNEGTLLVFCHDDWKEYTPMFAECNYTWGRFLRSLKSFCETGKGCPWPCQHR